MNPRRTTTISSHTDKEAMENSITATRQLLPPVWVEAKPVKSDFAAATTRFSQGTVHVDYNPKDASLKNVDKRVGQLTATFTHELAVHGKNYTQALQGHEVGADQEHREMFQPQTRKTYLDATHKAFNQLDNPTQKRAFVNEWARDMRDRLSQDEGIFNEQTQEVTNPIGKGEKRAHGDWITKRRRSMIHAINNPGKHDWTA